MTGTQSSRLSCVSERLGLESRAPGLAKVGTEEGPEQASSVPRFQHVPTNTSSHALVELNRLRTQEVSRG